MPQQRLILAMMGALAGGSLYLLFRMTSEGYLGERPALAAMVFAGVFFTSLLALTGPMDLPRAAARAVVQALVVAALVLWASLRFAEASGLGESPLAIVSALVLTFVPLPFFMAADGPGWLNYPALFSAAWGVVMRSSVAWIFVAILWAVIYLSHLLLSLVGIDVIMQIISKPPMPWLITGTGFGLAMAVAQELAEVVSAYLVLRLLRLLLPVILVVMLVFLGAVAVKGIGPLVEGFSIGAILLMMAGLAATLVTSAVDQTDAEATSAVWLRRATQALAAMLILPAVLAVWTIWQRVLAHGWTPDRLFAATVAALALGYGGTYLYAVLRRNGWMERIRQANVWMALTLMVLAALWLSVLSPEAISTKSQMARFRDGRTNVDTLDISALTRWGLAGQAARAELDEMAKTDPALARLLQSPTTTPAAPALDAAALRTALRADLPLQPATATAFRDQVLALASDTDLQSWQQACSVQLDLGGPGCVLVVADFLPQSPGDEGLLILAGEAGYQTYVGLAVKNGVLKQLEADSADGELVNFADGARLIAELQQAMPALQPVPRNQLAMPVGGAISLKP